MQELAKSFSELVNSLNGGAKGLAEAMQRVAPDAWRIAVFQEKLNGWLRLLFAVTSVAVLSKIAAFCLRRRREDKPNSLEWTIAFVVLLSSTMIIAWSSGLYSIPRLINPEYAAALELSKLFLGK